MKKILIIAAIAVSFGLVGCSCGKQKKVDQYQPESSYQKSDKHKSGKLGVEKYKKDIAK